MSLRLSPKVTMALMPTLLDGPSAVSPPPQAATIAAAASAASFHLMSFIRVLLIKKNDRSFTQ
ncbi:MAG: hypothetical protein IPH64_21340 [Comamonadaceae bacterium]|jgi:hypothetical protein|nr:hypothetical protein [Comamonadaceae bacterium]